MLDFKTTNMLPLLTVRLKPVRSLKGNVPAAGSLSLHGGLAAVGHRHHCMNPERKGFLAPRDRLGGAAFTQRIWNYSINQAEKH